MDTVMAQIQALLMQSDDAFAENKDRITKIVENVKARLLLRLKGRVTVVPDALAFIVVEVAVKRFNRLKNEGMSSYQQEGETISYLSSTSDFDEFSDDISQWLDNDGASSGKVRFLDGWCRE